MKYIDKIKMFYYRNLFKSCGKDFRMYGNIDIKNPNNIIIGDNCTMNDGVYINGWSKVVIGDNVALSAGAKLISTSLDIDSFLEQKHIHSGSGIRVGDNVQVGAGAIVLDGVDVGDNVIIGAGSIVTKTIPDYTVVAGSPAKILRSLNHE
jgi:maltose O-acetyltransferase